MAVRRTPKIKEAMVRALNLAIEYLNHPDMPRLSGDHGPTDIARYLQTCTGLIEAPGKLEEKKYILGDLQLAADYLDNPEVAKLPFAVRTTNIADMLREMIRDLK